MEKKKSLKPIWEWKEYIQRNAADGEQNNILS